MLRLLIKPICFCAIFICVMDAGYRFEMERILSFGGIGIWASVIWGFIAWLIGIMESEAKYNGPTYNGNNNRLY